METVNKFGVTWGKAKAKTNNLYLLEDISNYNISKHWFMLVLGKNDKPLYLAFHRTSANKKQIRTHIKTSSYSATQKLFEDTQLDKNLNASRKDYDVIFSNKELYAIPETHIEIIEQIAPSLSKCIEQFKQNTGASVQALNIGNNVIQKSEGKGFMHDKNIPLNQILYGPPGTGKTFKTKKIIEQITANNTENIAKNKFDNIGNLNWYSVIALAMYNHGQETYSVPELKNFEEIKAFSVTKNNNSVNAMLWGQLQRHTPRTNSVVKFEKRQRPFIFDKLENKRWVLNDEGKQFVEEQLFDFIENTDEPKQKEYHKFITFHQSYSYEDFVEGIKPVINGESESIKYELKNGVFKELCLRANFDKDNKYVLVIDEINRGNISKIFGELITLLEEDKRVEPNGEYDFENSPVTKNELPVTLPYSQKNFGVPKNLYIIGTMNTSDRSIASVDIALRRRFQFEEVMPNSELVADFGCNFKSIFTELNNRIKVLLDRDHQIGHSYFFDEKYKNADINTLKEIWYDSILPLLNEYFYGDWEKLCAILGNPKSNNHSFIQKISNIKFANNYTCDEDEMYDFVPKSDVDFEKALKNAFPSSSTETQPEDE